MEQWELDFYWLKVHHKIKETFNASELPDLETILFLIGVQELAKPGQKFSKEEKIDLIKLGVATLLKDEDYFSFSGNRMDGWPEFEQLKDFDITQKDSEHLIKTKIIHYFDAITD